MNLEQWFFFPFQPTPRSRKAGFCASILNLFLFFKYWLLIWNICSLSVHSFVVVFLLDSSNFCGFRFLPLFLMLYAALCSMLSCSMQLSQGRRLCYRPLEQKWAFVWINVFSSFWFSEDSLLGYQLNHAFQHTHNLSSILVVFVMRFSI